jgi:hypothetical protein
MFKPKKTEKQIEAFVLIQHNGKPTEIPVPAIVLKDKECGLAIMPNMVCTVREDKSEVWEQNRNSYSISAISNGYCVYLFNYLKATVARNTLEALANYIIENDVDQTFTLENWTTEQIKSFFDFAAEYARNI